MTEKKFLDFRKMCFYQIWIRSFSDGNGDGIGDLYGVYNKLSYIKSLGVDGIWFSPIFPSPNADFGYDISDYKNIHPDYGDLVQFKKVLDKAHEIGLYVLMDLVINHTSDEHPWFIESCKGKDNPYSDYYIWRDGKNGGLPNNWFSQFEGKAWEYNKERGQYYLHIFAKKQPDLNMDNPKVRKEVESIMRFWLDMGVDGFREDVITYISKHPDLPDGLPFLPAINGLRFYKDGPNLTKYLAQFRDVAREYGAIQIGEAPLTGAKQAKKYITGPDRVLDMVISFDHMMADCFITEYMHHAFSLRKFKRAISKWQKVMGDEGWNALYLENHDHPRIINRYGSKLFWRESGTMLAACYILLRGTPFVYQGQELGMTNIRLGSIEKYLDVASKNAYNSFFTNESVRKRLSRIHVSSRDSARTPLQWTSEKFAGFSGVKPWFFVNKNHRRVNAAEEEKDPGSILNFYRSVIALRKSRDVLLWGSYREFYPRDKHIFMYERRLAGERVLVICSFSHIPRTYKLPKGYEISSLKLLLDNYDNKYEIGHLKPYEVQVLEVK